MKKYFSLLGISTVVSIIISIILQNMEGGLWRLLGYPFEFLADVLRKMSLSGESGNLFAIAIYGLVCSIPMIIGVIKVVRKKKKIEDLLLVVMSAVLFAVIYIMINPAIVLNISVNKDSLLIINSVLSGFFYSVFIAYIVLKLTRQITVNTGSVDSDEKTHSYKSNGKKYLILMFYVLIVMFVFEIIGVELTTVLTNIQKYNETHLVGYEEQMFAYFMIVFRGVANVIPTVINIILVILLVAFTEKIDINNITDSLVAESKKIVIWCKVLVVCTVMSNLLYNLFLLIFIKNLSQVSGYVEIPLFHVIFALVISALARFVRDVKDIKEENDMFI